MESVMTNNKRKTMLTLPQEVVEAFRRARSIDERNYYAYCLRFAGWTLQSISEASGVTRERIRQVVAEEAKNRPHDGTTLGPIPSVPEHPVKLPRVLAEPDAGKIAEAASLQAAARSVRGNGTGNRAEAERYTYLVADMHLNDGVPLTRVALRLSEAAPSRVTHSALRDRLVRYGYMETTGDSKVYTRVLSKNRVL